VFAYAVLVWALLLTESNGGLVELGLGCLLIAAVAMYRRHGLVGAVACVLLTGVVTTTALTVVPLSSIQTWARTSGQSILVNSLGRSNDSSAQRSLLVSESLQLYLTGNTLGTGPATTKALLSARGYPYAKEAHDDYLAALVERGPVGLLGVVVLLASAAYRAGRLLRPRAGPPDPWGLPRPVGLVAALLATAAASTYYEVMHFRFVWALLALVAAASFADTARRGRQRRGAQAFAEGPP
jgi:O-antigen ligase